MPTVGARACPDQYSLKTYIYTHPVYIYNMPFRNWTFHQPLQLVTRFSFFRRIFLFRFLAAINNFYINHNIQVIFKLEMARHGERDPS